MPVPQLQSPHRYDSSWRDECIERGELPDRYRQPWTGHFDELIGPRLHDGMTILDVGSGREPVIAVANRPDVTYIGMDVAEDELAQAPSNSYDQIELKSITEQSPSLEGQIDLVVSWQVFEHVSDMSLALTNIHSYLKPGGVLVSLFSGRYSHMGVLNRLVSFNAARSLNQRLVGRRPESMFRTQYDRCYASALREDLSAWSSVCIEPRWEAAGYFKFSKIVRKTYLTLENRLAAGQWEDLATHYFLVATR